MIKHTQTIPRQQLTNFLSVFDHFVGLAFNMWIHVILEAKFGDDSKKRKDNYLFQDVY